MELGAFTVFLYALKAREWLFELLEEVSGARLTSTLLPHRRRRLRPARRASTPSCATSSTRTRDRAVGHRQAARAQPHLPRPPGRHRDHHQGRRARRTASPGPVGRSTGLAYDVRKDHPYLVYDRFDFDVPVGSVGDNFDRFAVRVEEMHAVDAHPRAGARADPGGPGDARRPAHRAAAQERDLQLDRGDDRRTSRSSWTASTSRPARSTRTPRPATASSASTSSPTAPAGRGSAACARPASRRPRCCTKVLPGLFIADVVPTFGMINMIGGECDR